MSQGFLWILRKTRGSDAFLHYLADHKGISEQHSVTAFLPTIGIIAITSVISGLSFAERKTG